MLHKFKIPKLSLIKSRSGLREIIKNTGWLFLDRVLRMGAGLVVGVWIARYLGVQQYGLFNYATAFVGLFSPVASLGLDSLVIRHLVHDSSAKEEILGTTFCLKLIGSILALLLAFGGIFLSNNNDSLTVWLVIILAAPGVFLAFDTIDLWFQSQVKSKYTVIAKNMAFLAITLVKVTLINISAPLLAFACATSAEVVLGAVGLAIAYRVNKFSVRSWRWSFSVAKSLMSESWPLIFSGFAIAIYVKIDQIMLGEMVGQEAVGIYAAAARISEVWYFLPTIIVSSSAPAIYAAKREADETLYYGRLTKLLRFLALVSVTIAFPMTFLSGTIINLLFGNGYAEAGTVLAIHIWASLFVFIGVAVSPWFVAEGLTHLAMYRAILGGITNVVLNLFLIPTYSGTGAAIATVISYAVGSFLANATHPKTRKLFIVQLKCFLFFDNI
ncbi:putative polysaccharide biosynthesis protein [Nostoc sp. NIES-4103]|nr:putative polysaccharide biosynthesis protein [Nostoc sp. NIES-4103]